MFELLQHRQITVTVVRGDVDTFGTWTETEPDRDVPGCWLAPSLGSGQAASRETGGLQNTVITGAVLYAPAGADILHTDRIRAHGLMYEVEGEVGDWQERGLQVSLRRSTG
jgi:hypothetical protein